MKIQIEEGISVSFDEQTIQEGAKVLVKIINGNSAEIVEAVLALLIFRHMNEQNPGSMDRFLGALKPEQGVPF